MKPTNAAALAEEINDLRATLPIKSSKWLSRSQAECLAVNLLRVMNGKELTVEAAAHMMGTAPTTIHSLTDPTVGHYRRSAVKFAVMIGLDFDAVTGGVMSWEEIAKLTVRHWRDEIRFTPVDPPELTQGLDSLRKLYNTRHWGLALFVLCSLNEKAKPLPACLPLANEDK